MQKYMKNKIALALLGARMNYQEAEILNSEGLLERLYTDFYIGNKPLFKKILSFIPFKPKPLINALERLNKNLPINKVKSFDILGIDYWFKRYGLKNTEEIDSLDAKIYSQFNKKIIKNLPQNISAVYGMNGASLELFQWAKERNIKCILHQLIAPKSTEKRILSRRFPSNKNEIEKREKNEWILADLIICASKFTRDSLIEEGADPSKCKIIPYQINLPNLKFNRTIKNKCDKLKILFAGTVGHRKGVPYLLEASDKLNLKDFEIILAGENNLPKNLIQKYQNKVKFIGRIPRKKMIQLYLNSDILVFPSLCEGFGFVIPEAMNAGLPVITTANTAAPEIIKNQKEGFIIPIRDANSIVEKLNILNKNRKLLYKLSLNAYQKAKKIDPRIYRKNLIKELKRCINPIKI